MSDNLPEPEPPEYRYWKPAISQLPNQEMRDAAWEFFVRHLAQNPKMGDTFSGIILATQAHGLYMLEMPRLIHDEALIPLGEEVTRFQDELTKTMGRHTQITKDIFAACEKTHQTAEAAATSVIHLKDIVRHGWQDVDTHQLSERFRAELEKSFLHTVSEQCRQLEEATPALKDVAEKLAESTRKLRAYHFKGILAVMALACVVVMGGCFSYGWWKLSRQYRDAIDAALQRILSVSSRNEDAFEQLTKLNAPFRVAPVSDSQNRPIPNKFGLLMEHACDVSVEDTQNGKRVVIYFEKTAY